MRVVIGEDEVLLREGLRNLLHAAGFETVATAGDADALLASVLEHRPDLVVTDIRMPPSYTDEGIRVAIRASELAPETAFVVLSQHVHRQYAVELLRSQQGGVGYLLKQRIAHVEDFIGDLHRVAAGSVVLDPEVVATAMSRAERRDSPVNRLTARQRDVLALFARGFSNSAVAEQLAITEKAVVAHASRIYDVLDLPVSDQEHRRVRAVLHFLSG
ncbi:MAG: hypothetical protein QOE97_2906 [Pseudonocardiales bacterium]|nr:hypothetical protein [Pseudonocardiales bacterium]